MFLRLFLKIKIVADRIIKLSHYLMSYLFGLIRSFFLQSDYQIKKGYFHRKKEKYFDDTTLEDEYQKEVYLFASKLMKSKDLSSIIDLGCGSGYKLIKYLGDFNTVGVDLFRTYNFLKEKYPNRKWYPIDSLNYNDLSAEVLICADVIEHVECPDTLIENIKEVKNVKFIIFSTPERVIKRGKLDFVPPLNIYHIREWSFNEFHNYIKIHFNIFTSYFNLNMKILCQ